MEWSDSSSRQDIRAFKIARGLDIEGISHVINYDIPWNPMRIEQRIGRVDRIGQAPLSRIH